MKNFKKVIALVLAVAMTLSTFTTAFAATANDEKATTLHELGLFAGKSVDEFVPALEDGATRAEAIKIIGTSLGWDVEDVTTVEGFDDVPAWAAPYVAYAVENEITNGVSDTSFGAATPVTARMVYTWYFRALGFDGDAWVNPSLLVSAGLANQATADAIVSAALAGEEEDILRDAIVGIMFDSLQWKADGSKTTLIADLIAAGTVDEAKAIAAKVYVKPIAAFTFALTTPSLKVATVTFSEDVKADTIAGNIEVKNGTTVLVNDTDLSAVPGGGFDQDYRLVTDGKVVSIIFRNLLTQSNTISVKLDADVKAVSGTAMVEATKTSVVKDYTEPAVVSAVATNQKALVITFSEPVNNTNYTVSKVYDNITVDGAKYVGAISWNDIQTVATLTPVTAFAEGSHTVKVAAATVTDFVGFPVAEFTTSVAVAPDTTAPVLVSVKADQKNKLVVTFDENIVVEAGDTFAVTNAAGATTTYNGAAVAIDGKVATVTINDLAPSDAFVDCKVVVKGVADTLGNTIDTTNGATMTFKATDDRVAPTVTAAVANTNVITLTFSEAIQAITAAELTVKNGNTTIASGVAADQYTLGALAADGKSVTVTLNTLAVNASTLAITVKNVKDNSVYQNSIAETTVSAVLADKKAPTAGAVITLEANNKVRITFDEAMDAVKLANAANYLYDPSNLVAGGIVPLSTLTDLTIAVAADGKSVDITKTGAFPAVADLYLLPSITDASNNALSVSNVAKTVSAADAFEAADLVSVTLTSLNTIEIAVDKETVIDADTNFVATTSPNDWIIKDAANVSASIYVTAATVNTTDNKIVLTLNQNLTADAKSGASAVSIYVTGTNTKDTYNQTLAIALVGAITVVDKVAPVVSTVATGDAAGQIKVTFSEAVKATDETEFLADVIVRDKNGAIVTLPELTGANAGGDADVDQAADDADYAAGFTTLVISGLTAGENYTVQVLNRNIKDLSTSPNTVGAYTSAAVAAKAN